MKDLIFLISFLFVSCSNQLENERWPDNSLKTLVKKERFKETYKNIVLRFHIGEQDSLNFYQREIFLPNGQILERANFKNKELNGKFEQWYSNGQKAVECFYKSNEITGLYISWYPDGKVLEKIERDTKAD